MTEKEYVLLGNRVKLDMVLRILGDIQPGDEYGVPREEFFAAYRTIDGIMDSLFDKVDVDET